VPSSHHPAAGAGPVLAAVGGAEQVGPEAAGPAAARDPGDDVSARPVAVGGDLHHGDAAARERAGPRLQRIQHLLAARRVGLTPPDVPARRRPVTAPEGVGGRLQQVLDPALVPVTAAGEQPRDRREPQRRRRRHRH